MELELQRAPSLLSHTTHAKPLGDAAFELERWGALASRKSSGSGQASLSHGLPNDRRIYPVVNFHVGFQLWEKAGFLWDFGLPN